MHDDQTVLDGTTHGDIDFEEKSDTVSLSGPFSSKPNHSLLPHSPEFQDEESAGGSGPNPESDDDTLELAHSMGLQLDEDEEHPKSVNIARDVDAAEEYIRTH